ncbi:hypothetical protein ACYZT7_21360 [Pseudomonas sp. RT4P38]
MSHRCGPVLGLLLIPTAIFAAPPGPEATAEYHAAQQALENLTQNTAEVLKLAAQQNSDRMQGQAVIAEMSNAHDRLCAHLEKAIASGHAVALHLKARLLLAQNPLTSKKEACSLYGQSAALGLLAGAVEHVKCLPSYPYTAEYGQRLEVLKSVIEEPDPYQTDYPLPMTFPYCFPKHKPALKPDEDAIQWVIDNASPQALSSEDFRAEGYYRLAMASGDVESKTRGAEFLISAFAHGCREDSARIAKSLGVTVPPSPMSASPTGS